MKIKWNDDLTPSLERMSRRLGAAVLMIASTSANIWETTAKANRPWTDRTGEARRKLHAYVSQPDDGTVRITLSHGVYYGVNLEYDYGEKYKIIRPTIEQEAPKTLEACHNLMDKLK